MRTGVLVIWIATAAIGLYLLTIWLQHGGLRQQSPRITRYPAALIFSHPAAALSGLSLWVAYLLSGVPAFAWTAFSLLSVSALLGFVMFTRWVASRGKHARGAEQSFPVTAVALHGTIGVVTFVLVLMVASVATH